ncbi:MAG: hypothetical protein M0P13_04865 [Fibrobacteraceae bacterium]|nr:hypothetical protein [Fibrobacteraceae bacterium]
MQGINISSIILLILLVCLLVGAHFIPVMAEKARKAICKHWKEFRKK